MDLRRNNFLLAAIIFLTLPPTWATAAPGSPAGGIYGTIGGKFGYGKAFSEDKSTVASRTLVTPGLEAAIGYQYGYFIFGAAAEHTWWQQRTEPADVGNSNVQGKMLVIAPVIGIGGSGLRFLVRYFPLVSSYKFSQQNSAGQTQEYSSASQLSLQAHAQSGGASFWGVEYSRTKFEKRKLAGTESALAAAEQLTFQSYSLIYGFKF